MGIEVRLTSDKTLRVTNGDAEIETTVGTSQSTFSSEELILAALGSCVAGNMILAAEKEHATLENVTVRLRSVLALTPPRISKIRMEISLDEALDEDLRDRLIAIGTLCKIHNSLHQGIHIDSRVGEL